jgi:hypothetical protein
VRHSAANALIGLPAMSNSPFACAKFASADCKALCIIILHAFSKGKTILGQNY